MSKPSSHPDPRQSAPEEIANAISHGLGTLLAIAGLVLLVVFASLQGDPWKVVSFSIYGTSLVGLYFASTLYHSFRKPRVKRFFKRLDHSFIYVLIAGTYTPMLLVLLNDSGWGWSMFGVIWGLAVLGVIFKAFFIGRFHFVSVGIYLLMGWLIVIAWKPIVGAMPDGMLTWIAIGGGCYTVGVIFYAWRTFPFHHTVWHLFVLAGSISHWFAMLRLLPA